MMKLKIHDVVVTEREVELPTECPKCANPFVGTDDYNLTVYSLLDAETDNARIGNDGLELQGNTEPLEISNSYPISFSCADCGHLLATGNRRELTEVQEEERSHSSAV